VVALVYKGRGILKLNWELSTSFGLLP